MKRTRDDVFPGSQFKRPFPSSRVESYGQSQVTVAGSGGGGSGGGGAGGGGGGGSTSQKLTTNDALTYLKEVKDMFQDQREKYEMFLEVMKDFKAQRTDTAGVIARVKELFKGHNNLILGFNTFLPKGYEITVDEDEAPTKKTVEFEEAISFVNKIKKRFQNDEHVYKSFLDILNMYRKEHKDINEVYNEVATLFDDHPDLLDEFTRFLPDNSAAPVTPSFPFGRGLAPRHGERSSAAPASRQLHPDKQRRRDRIPSAHVERDLSVDRPDMDDEKVTLKVQKDQRKQKDNRDRKSREQDDRESEHDNKDFNAHHILDKRKSSRKVEGFGMNSNFRFSDDKDALKGMYNEGFMFCEKVKERLCSSDDYQAFLKCLHIYSNGIIKRNDLQNLVTDLLGKHPDLMDEFNDFLERCENIDGFLAGVMSKKSLSYEGSMHRPAKVEEKDKEHKREAELAKEKERSKEKYWAKSIQELDLSDCQRCTPSYRLLPDDYPIPTASQKSELGAQVLNDHWVSVTSGSEDYSFKHMRRNQYEESLFRCEDDRFELDMVIESVSSAAKRAEELLNSFDENKTNLEPPIQVENYFTALHLRCIERLYGDHGLDVMDIFRKNPTVALPVILNRLKQKQEEWTKCRADLNKVWADVYAKNHYKSLDHRSFYFKQQDSKNLSTKTLVAEIKELKEKQQKEDDLLFAIAAGNRQPIVPQLDYRYTDEKIHEDLYKLFQYSCEEVCSTKEQFNKVMRLWTTFLEPMLGVPSRTHAKVSSEVNGKNMHGTTSFTLVGRGESDRSPNANIAAINLKQPKSEKHRGGNVSPDIANISRASLVNGDASAKEHSFLEAERVCRDDSSSNSHFLEKEAKGMVGAQDQYSEAATVGRTAVSGQSCHGRMSMDVSLAASNSGNRPIDGQDSKVNSDAVPPLEARAVPLLSWTELLKDVPKVDRGHEDSKLTWSEMRKDDHKVDRGHEDSAGPPRSEKEEGELSPNGDFEENSADFKEDGGKALPKTEQHIDDHENHSVNGEGVRGRAGGVVNGPEADDEDSENVSERGGDVSGSESAGDECSHEENEEEEDAEHDEADGKAESEGEAEGMTDANCIGGDGMPLPFSERFLSTSKPLSKRVQAVLFEQRKDYRVFYGNDDFYVLFRLHQTLYERILSAKTHTLSAEKQRNLDDSCSPDPYSRFMSSLYNLLDGTIENAKFEDECRAIIGNQSYVLFTLDKLIYKLVKQLQLVASDDMDNKLLQLYEYERSRRHVKFIDSVYFENVRVFLHDENIYRMNFSFAHPGMSIQLMDNVSEKPEVFAVSIEPNFAAYLHNDFLLAFPNRKEPRDIYLQRNKNKYSRMDENTATCMALEGVQVFNGLECKIACISSKISYVLDTEDFFFRPRKKRMRTPRAESSSSSRALERVQRFHRFLSSTLAT